MNIIRHIKVDLYGDTQHFAVAAKQMDMGTRYVGVTLLEDGVVYEIPDNAEIIINMTKPDKTHVHNDGEKSGNEALVPLTRGMLMVHGTAQCEIQLYQNGALLTSATFEMEIFPSQRDESEIVHSGEYTRLENILFGMLFLYGILDIYECCEIIRDNMIEDMTYDELEEFVMHRVVFWQSGILLRNQTNLRLIYASREVDDRNDVFIKWTINKDISWKIYSEDQYKELALSNGVGNWSGIPELFDFVMQNIEDDQYQAMMIVKSLVVKIQNGVTYTEITEAYTGLLEDNAREEQRTLCDLILKLYKTVPVYALKGHTREELEEEETGHRFQVIPGGKE